MVIDNLNILHTAIGPAETDTKLHIDAQRVLTLAILLQCKEPIARRKTQVVEFSRSIKRI